MTAHFADRLFARVAATDSRLCVGLDPDLARFPLELLQRFSLGPESWSDPANAKRIGDCLAAFCLEVLDATHDLACAVKFQIAHFEAYGHHGLRALTAACLAAKARGLPVIMDAKRNDIGSTARRYARAYLGPDTGPDRAAFACDALTVTPFLGEDGIKPFVDACAASGKGLFILVKTSNPSGAQVQDLPIARPHGAGAGETVAERLAALVDAWGEDKKMIGKSGYSAVGAVIGATQPESLPKLRALMPRAVILMPGFGAQGAGAGGVRAAFDDQGMGAIVNSSRSIIYPCDPDEADYFGKVREKATGARGELNAILR
ncbi:MAG: orotidine-5'-phosphate decarboxylase [Desulfovibrionaceae bacterium]|nr:orotidine-5'-phosphate decarboxylase [Desulfovibrionaceae bacterium]MBF0513323.1 orotidine-5'-phosphate decarboxylase [Desulfovibrionaceae bacterium]